MLRIIQLFPNLKKFNETSLKSDPKNFLGHLKWLKIYIHISPRIKWFNVVLLHNKHLYSGKFRFFNLVKSSNKLILLTQILLKNCKIGKYIIYFWSDWRLKSLLFKSMNYLTTWKNKILIWNFLLRFLNTASTRIGGYMVNFNFKNIKKKRKQF